MAQARRSTAERRRERDQCREALSNHIQKKLRLTIKPADIRLKPRPSDSYAWKVLPSREHFFSDIFSRNLSDHSISTYRLLCREVGHTFEAVSSTSPCPAVSSAVLPLSTSEPSFSTVIDELHQKCSALSEQVRQLQGREEIERERRQIAEDEICRLRNNQQLLNGRLQSQGDELAYYKALVMRCSFNVEKAMPLLETLRKDTSASYGTQIVEADSEDEDHS